MQRVKAEMVQGNDYEYDVFFSYKRHDKTLEWTKNLQEHLQFWLSEELERPAKMFVDIDTIEIGDHWPDRLRQGLRLSKCMVAVWSPLYFQSKWCVSEWKSFLAREDVINIKPHGLIAPVRFYDGDHFPAEAQQAQCIDVSQYASALAAFWTSSRALELEDKIKQLASGIAAILVRAPEFRPDWPVVDAAPTGSGKKIPLGRL